MIVEYKSKEHLSGRPDIQWFERYGFLKWLPETDYKNGNWKDLPQEKNEWGLVYDIATNGKEIRFVTKSRSGNWY